jgi:hypothetical protein
MQVSPSMADSGRALCGADSNEDGPPPGFCGDGDENNERGFGGLDSMPFRGRTTVFSALDTSADIVARLQGRRPCSPSSPARSLSLVLYA